MNNDDYDVIIIGAGIGGLVCGCLLAKQGVKTLIVEKSAKPGGYCTSFTAKGYEFDAFVHSLGNLSKGAQFYDVLNALGLYEKLDFIRFDPTDTLITPDGIINYWTDANKTIEDYSKSFPAEAENIKNFFTEVIKKENLDAVANFRNKTFQNVLDNFFEDNKLKAALSLVILGNLGVPGTHINAFTAIKHYRQFMIDGGYYPRNGIQAIPDALAEKFQQLGGRLMLSNQAVKIFVENKTATGVLLRSNAKIRAKFIVSDCDARQTFFNLLGKEYLSQAIIDKLELMKPSLSLFVVYLGFDAHSNCLPPDGVNTWIMPGYDYDKIHLHNIDYESDKISWLLIRANYSKKNCMIFTHAPFRTPEFWKINREIFAHNILTKAEEFFPGLSKCASFINSVDPSILNTWTFNYKGSGYGWAATPDQFMDPDFCRDDIVQNIFLCGHWSTIGQGVEGVVIVGERIAEHLCRILEPNSLTRNSKD